MAYLKIENPGICPSEGFTVLGVSMADTCDQSIGQFGTGNKHGVAVLLRHGISPVIYSGNTRMDFSTTEQTVNDGLNSKNFSRVRVQYNGRRSEELGFVLDFGKQGWDTPALALREFVSNAIDRAVREFGDWSKVKIEIVEEPRAKRDHTRIFVPLTPEVYQFYHDLGKWFLHFSEPESLKQTILPKKNRNLDTRQCAVIYRRGVRVREFEATETRSLFDYNLELTLDESRKATDWDVRYYAAQSLTGASHDQLVMYFNALFDNRPYWEHTFDPCFIRTTANQQKVWTDAFKSVAGDNGVITDEHRAPQVRAKGYHPITVEPAYAEFARAMGLRTAADVLSVDELDGRTIIDALPGAQKAVDFVWECLSEVGLTQNKEKPPAKCFTSIVNESSLLHGFYRDGVVYLNVDHVSDEPSTFLIATALEEIAHYITGATDNSRDFQDYVIKVAARALTLLKDGVGLSVQA